MLVAIERWKYPFPFRTRKSSTPSPMILPKGGKVGRCQLFFCPQHGAPGHGRRFFPPGRNPPPPPPAREKRPNFAFSRHGRHISRFSRFLSPTALHRALEACFSCRLAAKFRRLGGGGHGLRPLMPVLALPGAASRASVEKIEKKRRTVLTFQCEK